VQHRKLGAPEELRHPPNQRFLVPGHGFWQKDGVKMIRRLHIISRCGGSACFWLSEKAFWLTLSAVRGRPLQA